MIIQHERVFSMSECKALIRQIICESRRQIEKNKTKKKIELENGDKVEDEAWDKDDEEVGEKDEKEINEDDTVCSKPKKTRRVFFVNDE